VAEEEKEAAPTVIPQNLLNVTIVLPVPVFDAQTAV